MRAKPAASQFIRELWQEQIRQRTRTWNILTVPIVVLSCFVALWLLARLLGGTIEANNLLNLIIGAIVLSVLGIGGSWAYRYLEITSLHKDCLLYTSPSPRD